MAGLAALIVFTALAAPPPPDALASWFRSVRPAESFGELVIRAAEVQLGRPYRKTEDRGRPEGPAPEPVSVELHRFDCVSLLESSLAVARCVFRGRRDERCFLAELEATRYRDGKRGDFASRLHYLEDWLADNARRGRLELLGPALGGLPLARPVHYLSRRRDRYPALSSPEVRARIESVEARLSRTPAIAIGREAVARIEPELADGDIVAIVTGRPGILVSHAGLVRRGTDGRAHLLHASSHHRRVVLTRGSLAEYVSRRPEREAILVARPLAPRALSR
jgi:hypothetical protein